MLTGQFVEIEPVKLIARKDEHQIFVLQIVVVKILPDRISRTLVPTLLIAGLFGRENVDEAATETIKLICLLDMLV